MVKRGVQLKLLTNVGLDYARKMDVNELGGLWIGGVGIIGLMFPIASHPARPMIDLAAN